MALDTLEMADIDLSDRRLRIAISRRILARSGCESEVAGHVSERVPGENALWVSTLQYFDEALPEHAIKLSLDTRVLEGDWEASPAVSFHAAIMRGCPGVNSVIHTHSHYACVLATTGRLLGMYNDASTLFFERQVLHDNVVGEDLVRALDGHDGVVIIRNHGVIFASDSLEHATIDALTFERCAQIQVEAESIGGQQHSDDYARRGQLAYREFYVPQMWDANVRRLRRSDPELFTGIHA